MTELLPCKICGAPAVEQVRGLLTEADKGYVEPCVPLPTRQDTSNAPANATNTRIACNNPNFVMRDNEKVWQCNNATGWGAAEMADYIRFCWNRDNKC